jgi:hypothetical protein
MLAEDAIKSAISNYYVKNPKVAPTDLSGRKASMSELENFTSIPSSSRTSTP